IMANVNIPVNDAPVGTHRQEQLRTQCAQALEESYLPDCYGLTEEHQLL
ncbi:hypothetical protein Tco_1464222, partial [Tanacetum coccineum]